MLRLEKSARAPENTALKGPELENLCNDRVNKVIQPDYLEKRANNGRRHLWISVS